LKDLLLPLPSSNFLTLETEQLEAYFKGSSSDLQGTGHPGHIDAWYESLSVGHRKQM
jgi:hypothetical protein